MYINYELLDLYFEVMALGFLSIFIRRLRNKNILSASLAFWFAWGALITAGLICDLVDWTNISIISVGYIKTLLYGATVGFAVIDIFYDEKYDNRQMIELKLMAKIFIERKIFNKFLIFMFIIGMIMLINRIRTVGLSIEYFSTVRSSFVDETNYSFLLQLGSHLSSILVVGLILKGVYDYENGIDIIGLFWILLFVSPFFLSSASRTFLLGYPLPYISSYMLFSYYYPGKNRKLIIRYDLIKLLIFIISVLTVFSIIGFIRGGYGEVFNPFYAILMWPVSTLSAMDIWIGAASATNLTGGYFTFNWPFDILSRLHILNVSDQMASVTAILDYFDSINESAGVIPKSILPDIIFDFGPSKIFIVMAFFAALLQFFRSFSSHKLFLHVLAVNSFIAAFSTIQNSIFNSNFFVSIFWSYIIYKYLKNKSVRFNR